MRPTIQLQHRSSPTMSHPKRDESPGDIPSPPHMEEYAQPNVDASDLDGLSLYEKKCVLINREIDAQGMGRYQWYIWILCGFGYFLDLLWAQAFGLVLSPLQQEMGFGDGESGNISTSFNAGLTAGAFFWGFMSDIVGKSDKLPRSVTCFGIRAHGGIRSSLGIQSHLPLLLRLRSLSWRIQQLHHLPCHYSLCRLWCWRKHSGRQRDLPRVCSTCASFPKPKRWSGSELMA